MSNNKSLIVALGGLLVAAPALAADANLESLNYFEGAWRCAPAAAPGGAEALDHTGELAVLQFKRVLNHWLMGKVLTFGEETGEAVATLTYDNHEGRFVDIAICDKGGYGYAFAPGWEDDALTFTGYKHTQDGNDKHFQKVLTKKGADSFTMTYAESDDGKSFTVKKSATCRK